MLSTIELLLGQFTSDICKLNMSSELKSNIKTILGEYKDNLNYHLHINSMELYKEKYLLQRETNLVFDPIKKMVIGKLKDNNVVGLDENDIRVCLANNYIFDKSHIDDYELLYSM